MKWTERRDLYAEGVASGDPQADSVLLWTRRPFDGVRRAPLRVEVAEDEAFERVVALAATHVSADSDWTCRVLVSGLEPARVYWYRFADAHGFGSRIGRTITAPALNDGRPITFAFVSCQNVCQGAQNAHRRMIFEDEKAAAADTIQFVLHLGDFIYEIVWYPEDRPQGMYDRRLRDVVRYAHGEKVSDFHIPTTVDDYRAVYRAYLHDPDLQDARARWPFSFPKTHPLRALYLADLPGEAHPQPAINLLMRHGVRACLEYQKSGDIEKAPKLSNPDLSPHLSFLDMGGHGYATVRATGSMIESEFVCIPRPLERSDQPDGGPLRYRVIHTAQLWSRGERPRLEQRVVEGERAI